MNVIQQNPKQKESDFGIIGIYTKFMYSHNSIDFFFFFRSQSNN